MVAVANQYPDALSQAEEEEARVAQAARVVPGAQAARSCTRLSEAPKSSKSKARVVLLRQPPPEVHTAAVGLLVAVVAGWASSAGGVVAVVAEAVAEA